MLTFSQVVIIDELSINDVDAKNIEAGKTSKLERTLAWLADNSAMTLAALSSSSLLDRDTDGDVVSETQLDEMIARSGFMAISLKHIMRSSRNIATATSPARVNEAYTLVKIQKTISPGSSSTVPGTRPMAWVYKDTRNYTDHTKLAGFVSQHLRTMDTERLKCVVLAGQEISARMLYSKINTAISVYDGGVKRFNSDDIPDYRKDRDSYGGEAALTAWLRAEGGVLVTHEMQFRGAEADFVIFVTKRWGGYSITRSPVTRAVAGLLMITSDAGLNAEELSRYWEVRILERGQYV